MHPSQHLYRFIKSLDGKEVRYVRAFGKRRVADGTTSALRLFELILAAKAHSEKEWMAEVSVENYPALKVYLFNMVADALMEREMKRKGKNEIIRMRAQAEAFYRKELMDSFWKRLDDAMALCVRYEEFRLHWDMLRWKQDILMYDSPDGYVPEGMEDFDEVYPAVKAKARNLEAYQEIADGLEIARRSPAAMQAAIAALQGNPCLEPDAPRLSIKAEVLYRHVMRTILWRKGLYAESMVHTKVADDLLRSSPMLRYEETFSKIYMVGMHVTGMYAAATGDYALAELQVQRLREEGEDGHQVFEWVHSIRLRLALAKVDLNEGLAIIKAISDGFKRFEFKIKDERRMRYCFQVVHFLLFFSRPDLALPWVITARSLEKPGAMRGLYYFNEILYLVCHFDLGNFDFIAKSEASKALAYLKKNGELTEYAELVVKGLRKAAKAKDGDTRLARLERMFRAAKGLADSQQYNRNFSYFQFDLWLKSKKEGLPPVAFLSRKDDAFR